MNEVDRLDVHILVDNATDSLSSQPAFVETEFAGLRRRGMRLLAGRCLCCAAHGLSCLLTVTRGKNTHSLLFDTGPDEWILERNVARLGVNLGAVEAIVLSHGHWDHGGALPYALQTIGAANGARKVPLYLHPDMFALRATKSRDGAWMPMERVPGLATLTDCGAATIVTRDEQLLFDGAFYLSGEIPRQTDFEKGFPGQYRQGEDGRWLPDEMMPDERFVAVNVVDKGLVVFSACSHAGIVNVAAAVTARFPGVPLYGIFGGFHLSGAAEAIIPETVAALKAFEPRLVAAGHCTGWRAIAALAAAFGDALVPSAVGKLYRM